MPGFRAAGIHCGIKDSGQPDLALIASDVPSTVAGVFTQSSVVGAPVEICRERVRGGRGRAVVVNSGISNVATGTRGRRDAREMAALAAGALGCPQREVFVASTGVIGEPLPMARLRRGIPNAAAALSADGLRDAGAAILTTDTRVKMAHRRVRLGGQLVNFAGIAKGSGMIEPKMATMLAFLVSDAAAGARFLQRALRDVAGDTFNRVSVDGETSTSDSVLCFANGCAGNSPLRSSRSPGARGFLDALGDLCSELSQELARDGEGATKLIHVEVTGAASSSQAEAVARRIANSPLVKTAVFGGDPNWGRILQTAGATRAKIQLARARVALGGVVVFARGKPTGAAARRRAEAALAGTEVTLELHLGAGRGRARMWTCDLTPGYIRINAEYTT